MASLSDDGGRRERAPNCRSVLEQSLPSDQLEARRTAPSVVMVSSDECEAKFSNPGLWRWLRQIWDCLRSADFERSNCPLFRRCPTLADDGSHDQAGTVQFAYLPAIPWKCPRFQGIAAPRLG